MTAYQNDLADSHENVGSLLRRKSRTDEARTAFDAALAIRERLAREHSTIAAHLIKLAAIRFKLGNLLNDTGRKTEVRTLYNAALETQERLVLDHPELPEYQSELGATLNNLATLDIHQQAWGESRKKLQRAVACQRAVPPATAPGPARSLELLANHLSLLTQVEREMGNAEVRVQAARSWSDLARKPFHDLQRCVRTCPLRPDRATCKAGQSGGRGGPHPTSRSGRRLAECRPHQPRSRSPPATRTP